MPEQNVTHISYGLLTALSQSEQEAAEASEAQRHIQSCEICKGLYREITSSLNSQKPADYEKPAAKLPDHCCQNDTRFTPHFFLAFLFEKLGETSADRYFLHLNSCYPCFESFSRNWSDYLTFDPNKHNGA